MNKVADLLLEEEKPLDIRYYLNLITKKLSVIVTIVIIAVSVAAIYASKIPPRYSATAQLLIEVLQAYNTGWTTGGSQDASTYNPGQAARFGVHTDAEEVYFNTQREIMLSPSVLELVVNELNLKTYFQSDDINGIIETIREMIKIDVTKGSRVINVTVVAETGKLAAELANSLAENFLRKTFESILYYDQNVLSWLQQGGEGAEYITVTDPLGKITRLKYKDLIESLPPIQSDPTLRDLKSKLKSMQAELETMLLQYREKHPIIIKMRADINFIQETIEQEKRRIVETLKAKASGQMGTSPGRVIESARIPVEALPEKRLLIVIAAGVVAIVIGVLLVFALDYFDDTVRIMEDFERKGILLPFLGPLPLLDGVEKTHKKVPILADIGEDENRSAMEESFRYLRVAINFSAPPETVKVLAITSCLPGDGKSFVSTNLATSLSLDGNRVLLIDGDLRRPVIHTTFGMDNDAGLSNYLTSNVEIETVVRESKVENLSVLCSGPISPNPSEILGSDRMKTFFKEAAAKYDRIIIDCPPLTGIGDGFVVGSLIGHLILVVGAGKTPADLIRHTQQQVDKMGIKFLGTVLNRMDIRQERYGGYTAHYYHTYNKYYRRK